MLFQRESSYDFVGRLSFSWPASALVLENDEPLFKFGYGLSYDSRENISLLSEKSGLENNNVVSTGQFFNKGDAVAPWGLWLISDDLFKQIASFPTSYGGLIISKTDHMAQEDAIRINWTRSDEDYFRISSSNSNDMSRQSNGAMELTFNAKSYTNSDAIVQIGQCDNSSNCDNTIEIKIIGDWREYRISLSCFEKLGVDMTKITSALLIKGEKGVDIGLSDVRLESDIDAKPGCDGN